MQDWKMTDESARLENDGLEKMTYFKDIGYRCSARTALPVTRR